MNELFPKSMTLTHIAARCGKKKVVCASLSSASTAALLLEIERRLSVADLIYASVQSTILMQIDDKLQDALAPKTPASTPPQDTKGTSLARSVTGEVLLENFKEALTKAVRVSHSYSEFTTENPHYADGVSEFSNRLSASLSELYAVVPVMAIFHGVAYLAFVVLALSVFLSRL